MKRIDAVISRKNFPIIKDSLTDTEAFIVDKRNLDDSGIYNEPKQSGIDSDVAKPIPMAKIELAVSNKEARKVIEIVSKHCGLKLESSARIFVSEMEEIVDMDTLRGKQDTEITQEEKPEFELPKRSRFVPLQKFTLYKLQVLYEKNKETLQSEYRIKSFSDFVNYCVRKYMPILEKQLNNPTIIYEDNFSNF